MAENGVPKGDGRTQGPPKGSPMDSPWTGAPIPQGDSTKRPIPADEVRQRIERITGSTNNSLTRNDPGFQNPSDALDAGTRARSAIVYRDVPIVTIQNSWTVPEVRTALWSHMSGIFEMSGQLMDSMLGDDRVQATLGSRV